MRWANERLRASCGGARAYGTSQRVGGHARSARVVRRYTSSSAQRQSSRRAAVLLVTRWAPPRRLLPSDIDRTPPPTRSRSIGRTALWTSGQRSEARHLGSEARAPRRGE
eukprot:scaffold282850_cov32-Tisochrysis_lutea.AAC.2